MSPPANTPEQLRETVTVFWDSIPPLWHNIRSHIHRNISLHYDITVEQFHILRRVNRGLDSVSKLAEAKQISRAAISRTVDNLVNKGDLARQVDPDDRRHVRLTLTDQGRALMDAISEHIHEWMATSLSHLDEAELQNLNTAMQHLNDAFKKEENL